MINIKVYNDIAGSNDQLFFDSEGSESKVFSAESVKDMLNAYPEERELRFDIHCNGGSTREGFAIYDMLRTSGKKIHCNIDGNCHSMAIILLLAAPVENRSANPNATALIHDVSTYAGYVSAESARMLADDLIRERERILNIYADRTDIDVKALETIMLEEKKRTAAELLEWGFISRINQYTNQKKQTKMTNKKRTFLNVIADIKGFLRGTVNFDFTDTEGNVLFSTDNEDNSIAIGDAAAPDGVFALPDGRTVTIADGLITDITEAQSATKVENMKRQVESLNARLIQANALLVEAQNTIKNMSNIRSNARIQPRAGATVNIGRDKRLLTADERKAAIRINLGGTKDA